MPTLTHLCLCPVSCSPPLPVCRPPSRSSHIPPLGFHRYWHFSLVHVCSVTQRHITSFWPQATCHSSEFPFLSVPEQGLWFILRHCQYSSSRHSLQVVMSARLSAFIDSLFHQDVNVGSSACSVLLTAVVPVLAQYPKAN